MAKHTFLDSAESLLAAAGITINGPNPWDIQVRDERFYARIFADGTLGFGEAYMDGWWESGQLDETLARILRCGLQDQLPRNLRTLKLGLAARWTNRQRGKRAWTVGDQHYDLGNDLFAATFDSRLTASCGYTFRLPLGARERIGAYFLSRCSPWNRLFDVTLGASQ